MNTRYRVYRQEPGRWTVTQYGPGYEWTGRTWRECMNFLYPTPAPPSPDYYGSPAQAFLEGKR